MTEPTNRPPAAPVGSALLAAAAPPAFLFAILVGAAALAGAEGTSRFMVEGGPASYLVLLAAMAAAGGCALALYSIARGGDLPAAVPAFACGLPWMAGAVGTLWETRRMAEALAMVNPSDKVVITAVGLSESLSTRLLGAWSAGALLASVAVGLALAAVARPSPSGSRLSIPG